MNKKIIYSILTAGLLFSLAGCSNDGPFEILFEDAVPNCYVGEEYDFGDVLIEESGVNYTLEAYYQNYYEQKEYKVESSGLKFTQNEICHVSVVITATKGSKTKKRTQLVRTSVKADPIDDLLQTGGLSGYSDTGIKKEIVTDAQYLKEEGMSSLAVYYQGNNFYRWGASVLGIENFRLLDHWTDKTWENTILKFWCYNPTDYDIEFQLRIKDVYTGLVDVDWVDSPSIVQYAKPGVWTECLFPLHRIGVDHTLFMNKEGTRTDSITVKMRWHGTPTEEPTPLYTYQCYIDGVDCVPASRYPEVDTKCYAKAEHASESLENMLFDDGWQRINAKYDREVVRTVENAKSKSSFWGTFNNVSPNDTGYSVIYNVGVSYENADIEAYPDLSHGLLKADFKFSSNITNTNIKLIATDETWSVVKKSFSTTDLGDGWRRLEIDMAPNEEFVRINEPVRLGFGFEGINDSNKATAEVHMDNFFYLQNEGSPARPEMETYQEGLENLPIDAGWCGSSVSYDNITVNTLDNPKSRYSAKLTFNKNSINLGYGVTYSPESANLSDDEIIRPAGHKIEFYVKYSSNITNKDISLSLVQKSSWECGTKSISVSSTPNANGWYHVTVDMGANFDTAIYKEIIRIGIYFQGITDENKADSTVWIDNMFVSAIA